MTIQPTKDVSRSRSRHSGHARSRPRYRFLDNPIDQLDDGYSSPDDDVQAVIQPRAKNVETVAQMLQPVEGVKHDNQIIIKKFTGNAQTPRYRDAVAQSRNLRTPRASSASNALSLPSNLQRLLSPLASPYRPRKILHNWTQEVRDGQACASITLLPSPIKSDEDYTLWLHVDDQTPSLKNFENYFNGALLPHVPSETTYATQYLLAQVKEHRERDLKLGNYLHTGALRLDGTSSVADDEDHPCTFISFPYFAVGDFQSCPDAPGAHPVRSLLQVRYRLGTTAKREKQAISTLDNEDLRACIEPEPSPLSDSEHEYEWSRQKIFVPQLWALSIAGDMMITSGPISDENLRGLNLTTNPPSGLQNLKVIEFLVEIESHKSAKFLFPAETCEWYFGLLNKKHRILQTLDKRERFCASRGSPGISFPSWHPRGSSASNDDLQGSAQGQNDALGPSIATTHALFQLYLRDDNFETLFLITSDNWRDRYERWQNRSAENRLTVYMTRDHHDLEPHHHPQMPGQVDRGLSSPEITTVKNVVRLQRDTFDPFLTWQFKEEQIARPERSRKQRVQAWLDRLLARVVQSRAPHVDLSAIADTALFPKANQKANRQAISGFAPVEMTSKEAVWKFVQEFLKKSESKSQSKANASNVDIPTPSNSSLGAQIEGLFARCSYILDLFVPARGGDNHLDFSHHHSVRLYWGLVRRILSCAMKGSFSDGENELLLRAFDRMIDDAEKLHKGVQKLQPEAVDTEHSPKKIESAVILTPIRDSFDHIIELFFGLSIYSHSLSNRGATRDQLFNRDTEERLETIWKCFTEARRILIATADEGTCTSDKSLGPLATPEAILMLLIERLSRGCYNDRSIDVIEMYERVMTHLAAKVEHGASRYLLQEIHRVLEELSTVADVLAQQRQFLLDYGQCLDPRASEHASIRRWARHPFERRALDRILQSVNDRTRDCAELTARAVALADTNVRLVDSYQDDNNRTLMLFTVVTITFLPLSFFTGYFGMNLHGIVDTERSASLFWWVSAPVTVAVVLVSLALTYLNQTREMVVAVRRAGLRWRKGVAGWVGEKVAWPMTRRRRRRQNRVSTPTISLVVP